MMNMLSKSTNKLIAHAQAQSQEYDTTILHSTLEIASKLGLAINLVRDIDAMLNNEKRRVGMLHPAMVRNQQQKKMPSRLNYHHDRHPMIKHRQSIMNPTILPVFVTQKWTEILSGIVQME